MLMDSVGQEFWQEHSRDSLSLLHDVWDLIWEVSMAGGKSVAKTGIIKSIFLHISSI